MSKSEIIERVNRILDRIEDSGVLLDIYNLIAGVYRFYSSGRWER